MGQLAVTSTTLMNQCDGGLYDPMVLMRANKTGTDVIFPWYCSRGQLHKIYPFTFKFSIPLTIRSDRTLCRIKLLPVTHVLVNIWMLTPFTLTFKA